MDQTCKSRRWCGPAMAGSPKRRARASCCAPAASCCGPTADPDSKSREMGYSEAELAAVPDGANLGLGCGNPQAIAALKPGEIVIDLGSGAGFDCFLAARQVGADGPCDRRRHDARDAEEGARERRQDRRRAMSSSASASSSICRSPTTPPTSSSRTA